MTRTTVLNPISMPPAPTDDLGAGLPTLMGKTIGFLSNNKPNADAVLRRLAARLQSDYRIVAKHYNKGVPSLEAPIELVEEVGRDCQAVVLAVYD